MSYLFSDFINVYQVIQTGIRQFFDGAEGFCDFLGHRFAYKTDAQSKQYPFVGYFLRTADALDDVIRRFLAHPVQPADIGSLQGVKIGYVPDKSFLVELVDGFRTQSFDVHGLAADEMFYLSFNLRRTGRFVRAVMGSFVFVAHQRASTFRTMGDERYLFAAGRSGCQVYTGNFRDNLPTLFHVDTVADVQVQRSDDVCIMQRGTFHYGT